MVLPADITTSASLLEALDARSTEDPLAAQAFDEAVWAARGVQGAMLVTDLSGFTRVTKRHGILHFLAMFRRCQVTCLPAIARNGGVLLKQEADDFIALFPDAPHALRAALEMLDATRALNLALKEEDRVSMCVGIEWGSLLRLDDDAFGDAVNVAFKLGEDVARPNEIRVGLAAFERLERSGLSEHAIEVSEKLVAVSGGVPLEHYCIVPKGGS